MDTLLHVQDLLFSYNGRPVLAIPELEKTLIRIALKKACGGRQEAAKILGWGRNTLTRKMRQLEME